MSPENARVGIWTDYTANRQQILATDFWANVMKTLVAVTLALSSKYITEILQHWGIRFLEWWYEPPSPKRGEEEPLLASSENAGPRSTSHSTSATSSRPEDHEVLSPNSEAQQTGQDNPVGIFDSTHGGRRDLIGKICRSRLSGSQHTALYILLLVLFAVFIMQIIAGVFSAKVATDRAALWASDCCGIWMFDDENAGQEAASRADLYDREKESRAGEYARNCYGNPSVTDPTHCEFFYFRNITYNKPCYSYVCPFPSKEVCAPSTQSVTFDTDLVDASLLGINSPVTHKFRRRTACSPLNLEGPFVTNATTNGSTTYLYNYGHTMNFGVHPANNITYSTTGDPFIWQVAGYKLAAYTTSLFPQYDYWQPIPELSPPENSTLTVIFINSLHVTYPMPSSDPIFPADKLRAGEPWYYNSDPRARAIGCIDLTELCSPDGDICWSMKAKVPGGVPVTPAYWLMKFSLEMSSIYHSMHWRLGSSLIANSMISQYRSKALNDGHWVSEVQRMFDSTLARAQFDAWSIASGEDSVHEGPDGYVEETPPEAGNLCNKYKFKSSEHTNINLSAFILLLFTPLIFWVLSRKQSSVASTFRPGRSEDGGTELGTTADYRNRRKYPYDALVVDFLLRQALHCLIALFVTFPVRLVASTRSWAIRAVGWVKEKWNHSSFQSSRPPASTNF